MSSVSPGIPKTLLHRMRLTGRQVRKSTTSSQTSILADPYSEACRRSAIGTSKAITVTEIDIGAARETKVGAN